MIEEVVELTYLVAVSAYRCWYHKNKSIAPHASPMSKVRSVFMIIIHILK